MVKEQQRRQLGAVEEAQINESDIELLGWKSYIRSPARQKEHKEAKETLSLVFICCGDIYLILLPPDSL